MVDRLEQINNNLIIEIRDIQAECQRMKNTVESIERPIVEIKPNTTASIIFTSGTAYDPKGVMLSHQNFITNVLAVAEELPPQTGEHFLSVLPLYHALEFTCGFLMSITAYSRDIDLTTR